MAQAGFTPISLYYSATASSVPIAGNLVPGELAINIADGILYYKNASNVVVPYSSGTATTAANLAGGSALSVPFQSAANTTTFAPVPTVTGSALTFNGTTLAWSLPTPGGLSTNVQYNNAGVLSGSNNLTFDGTVTTALQMVVTGSATLAAFKVPNIKEVATITAAAATGVINYNITTQSVILYTLPATANFTLNFRGSAGTALNSIMAVGESMSVTFMCTNGATPYYASAVQIDGTAVTPLWQGGTAPAAGNANAIDAYTFAILKTAPATYVVIGSQTQFS